MNLPAAGFISHLVFEVDPWIYIKEGQKQNVITDTMTDKGAVDYLSYCLEGFFYGKVIYPTTIIALAKSV